MGARFTRLKSTTESVIAPIADRSVVPQSTLTDSHCLADNIGLVTAYSNDVSYDDLFVMQLKNLLNVGNLVIGISGSGNSENVLRAIAYANDGGGVTLGLSGFGGGKLRQLAQHNICTNVHDMQLSEDLHLVFGHTVMKCLCASR
jgi:D-sedoheptulose 7-phosphate isomerase